MKLRICLLILSLMPFCQEHLFSQVSIGTDSAPKDYCVLEMKGIGGLRLPNLTVEERNELESTLDADASGLVIYNKDENCFEFWNGNVWISLKNRLSLMNSTNGISGNENFKLGGNLTENTAIAQGTNNLFFDVSTGRFTVSNALTVTKDGVAIGKETPTALLDIQSASGEGFRYSTGAETGLVLKSDDQGNARWVKMAPEPYRINGSIKVSEIISSTASTETPVAISEPLRLTKGIWLIVARYVAISNIHVSSYYNSWIRLRKVGENMDICTIAQLPYKNVNGGITKIVTTPQLMYILEVQGEEAFYQLYGDLRVSETTNPNVYVRGHTDQFGDSYFRAIRLTE